MKSSLMSFVVIGAFLQISCVTTSPDRYQGKQIPNHVSQDILASANPIQGDISLVLWLASPEGYRSKAVAFHNIPGGNYEVKYRVKDASESINVFNVEEFPPDELVKIFKADVIKKKEQIKGEKKPLVIEFWLAGDSASTEKATLSIDTKKDVQLLYRSYSSSVNIVL